MFGGKLYSNKFDFLSTIFQIISMQLAFYFSLASLILMFNTIASLQSSLGQLFSPDALNLSQRYAVVSLLAHEFNILPMVLANAIIVEKAKKVLDFTLTVFGYHFLFVCLTYGFPTSIFWWFIQTQIIVSTVLLSELLCMKIETSEIALSIDDIIKKGKEGATKIIEGGKKIVEQKKKAHG